MALYVAICVLAALTAVSDEATTELRVLAIVWGTTIGLALAHWFAFNVSSRLVREGTVRRRETEIALAEISGAAAVAIVATVPVLLLPKPIEYGVVRFVLALFIGVVAYEVARSSGADRVRSTMYALSVLFVAMVVVVIKNFLLGH